MTATELEKELLKYSEPQYHSRIQLYFETLQAYVTLARYRERVPFGYITSLMARLKPYAVEFAKEMDENARFFREMSKEEEEKTRFLAGSREKTIEWCLSLANGVGKIYREAEMGGTEAGWRIALDSIMGLEHLWGTALDGMLGGREWQAGAEGGYYTGEDLVMCLGDAVALILGELARG